jgi:hypothetical protein
MKQTVRLTILLLAACMMTSCWTIIETVAPKPAPTATTTYTVTTPRQQSSTTTIVTTQAVQDYYQCLDLRAVAAAFAQSRSIMEFERLLNSGTHMLTNLDLNRDGYVDYIRVIETMNGYNHVIVLQAVLAINVFQNVATLVVNCQPGATYVQVIGDPFIYGANYIIEPVFVRTPVIYTTWYGARYTVWTSPYYWDHFPNYYGCPAVVYHGHYTAYVDTYLSGHGYCNEVHYTTTYRNPSYSTMTETVNRNDYGVRHVDQSFSSRHNERSARDLETTRDIHTRTTTTQAPGSHRTQSSTTTQPASTGSSTRSTTTQSSSSTSSARSTRTQSGSSSRTTTTTSPRQSATTPGTTVTTRVNTNNGSARTQTRTTDANGTTTTVRRSTSASTSTRSQGTTTRQTGTTNGTQRRTGTQRQTNTTRR